MKHSEFAGRHPYRTEYWNPKVHKWSCNDCGRQQLARTHYRNDTQWGADLLSRHWKTLIAVALTLYAIGLLRK